LLLVHGTAGSWTHWARNILPLARHCTVLAPDLPGHGDSDLPAGEVSCAAFAATLWEGIDQLAGPEASAALAGFSLGSILVESMAMARPGQTRQAVLLRGSFSRSAPPRPPELLRWKGVQDPVEVAGIHRHNLAASMFCDAGRIDDAAVALHAANLERMRLDVRPLLGSRQFDAFTSLACPVLGISGEFDIFGGNAREEGMALEKSLPQARFHLVKGAGHWAAYEAADEVNAVMAQALASSAV
jgi:pimeloyl-ACP methyl ester carboxylesterase